MFTLLQLQKLIKVDLSLTRAVFYQKIITMSKIVFIAFTGKKEMEIFVTIVLPGAEKILGIPVLIIRVLHRFSQGTEQ